MAQIGLYLDCEEHGPKDLVKMASQAEDAGFPFLMISDHYHPWISRQGESPFTWSVLGGIARATERIEVTTGVTCPTFRYHPAIIAQAAATIGTMMPGRFKLGLGSGENLNEHIYGDRWPPAPVRIEMLAEAVDIIRTLWQGGMQDYYGAYFLVENAQIFTLPDELPPILLASEGQLSAELAGRIGDGLINAGTKSETVERTFREAGGRGKTAYILFHVYYSEDEKAARRAAYEEWPIAANKGNLNRVLPTPTHFEQLATMVTEEDVAKHVVIGPDPSRYIEKIQSGIDKGYDHICIHQIGKEQEGFIEFAQEQILPEFQKASSVSATQAEARTL